MACNGAGGKGAEVEVGETSPVGGEAGLFCDDPDCCRFIGLALIRAKIGLSCEGEKEQEINYLTKPLAECRLKKTALSPMSSSLPHLECFYFLPEILVRLLRILGAIESDIPGVVNRRLA